jgi:hypothetical protein
MQLAVHSELPALLNLLPDVSLRGWTVADEYNVEPRNDAAMS